MAIVYVVTSGSYSDYGINSIFSTEELAKAYIAEAGPDHEIEEWDMDADIGVKLQPTWQSGIDLLDGSESRYANYPHPVKRLEFPFRSRFEVKTYDLRKVVVSYSTVSKEHSLKVAVEARQALLREQSVRGPQAAD